MAGAYINGPLPQLSVRDSPSTKRGIHSIHTQHETELRLATPPATLNSRLTLSSLPPRPLTLVTGAAITKSVTDKSEFLMNHWEASHPCRTVLVAESSSVIENYLRQVL